MTKQTYPYKAWTLTPSFKPVEVELVASWLGEWEESTTGKWHRKGQTFLTKQEAIVDGYRRLALADAALEKRRIKTDKQRAALKKAEKQ